MDDSYLKSFSATVTKVDGQMIELDKTAFYPSGGGQPNDTGMIIIGESKYDVINVIKKDGSILHQMSSAEGLAVGSNVKCEINWERRYRLMKMHTAAHILDAVLYKNTGALATGGQLGIDKSRIDFSLESADKNQIANYIENANEAISEGIGVQIKYMNRNDAMKIEGIVKLANVMPPDVTILRIVEIMGIDMQADGGTHVKNTREIGKIQMLSVENRGKNNRRIYFTLV